ncbi:MAG: AroM family protein [Propioniciclava sp.]
MSTLNVVTIGQAPRDDLTPELTRILNTVSILQNGALDLLSEEEIRRLAPGPEATGILTSRLRSGGTAVFTHADADPLVEAAISRGEEAGADATLVICSSHFPELAHTKPVFFLEPLAHAAVTGLLTGYRDARLGVLCPLPEQEAGAHVRWRADTGSELAATAAASPYTDSLETIAAAVARLAESSDVVVLDCAGYSAEMAAAGRVAAGGEVPVLTVRGLGVQLMAGLLT